MLNHIWTFFRSSLGLILFLSLPSQSILANDWSLHLNPFVGSGHSSFSSNSQTISGAMIAVHREFWNSDYLIIAPSLALHSLNSYYSADLDQGSRVSSNRHMNALVGIHGESRTAFGALGLKPFLDFGLGYGKSEIKITHNDVGSYTEFAYDSVGSYLLKMSLGIVHALNERLSVSLAYNYLQLGYSLGKTPNSSYQETFQAGFGLQLTDSPENQETIRTNSSRQTEHIHSAQLGLSVKL